MAASQAEWVTQWGVVMRGKDSTVRTYDSGGNCYSLSSMPQPGWCYAIDIEDIIADADNPVLQALGADAPSRWAGIEVIAKLTNMPAHLVLRQVLDQGLDQILEQSQIEIRYHQSDHHILAIGRRPE
ncbi:MAG: hypothetical protein Alpg2KO_11400 [Alphaproteobacteria bacterium]